MAHLRRSDSCPGELHGERLVVGAVLVERWQIAMSKPLCEAQGRCVASFQPVTNRLGTCSYVGRQLFSCTGHPVAPRYLGTQLRYPDREAGERSGPCGWTLLTRARTSRPTEQGSLMARSAFLQNPAQWALLLRLVDTGRLPVFQPAEGLDPSCRLPSGRPLWRNCRLSCVHSTVFCWI